MPTLTPATSLTAPEVSDTVERYWLLARKVASRWASRWPALREEFESQAAYTLWIAATEWNPSTCPSFATALHRRLKFAFLRVLRRERSVSGRCFRQLGITCDETGQERDALNLVADAAPGAAEVVEHADDLAHLPAMLGTLREDRRAELERRYIEGASLAEIADARGVKPNTVGMQLRETLDELRKRVGG